MRMRRVLHVIRTSGVSGAENHLAELVAGLPAHGWCADVLLTAVPGADLGHYVERLERGGGRVITVPAQRDLSLPMLVRLRRALAHGTHDLVHTHLVHADWHAALAAPPRGRTPLVSTKHNHDPFRARQPFKAFESLWLRRCAATIAISESLADFVALHNGVRPVTIRYGWPAPADAAPREERPVRSLLAAGRLEPQKGYDVLVAAIADVPGVRLDIAGEGGQRGRLEALIAQHGVGDRVRLLGQRSDVPELLSRADAFVHSARWEGFGLVLLEAMAAALPMVATRAAAIPEVVGDTALLVSPDDPAAMAEAIRRLTDDPAFAQRLGAEALERLRTHFTPEEMVAKTAAVYERVLR
jgi:glycosyltransferase involved in cell wall biosynthesis